MIEVWKPVKGYEGIYTVSNYGNLKSVFTSKILKPAINQYGYKYHGFRKNKVRTNILIHRIVAFAFIENKQAFPVVNHKDGNKLNNEVLNLEWCTHKQNMEHASRMNLCAKGEKIFQSKLKENEVIEIREKYKTGQFTYFDLSKQYNVSFSLIGQIVKHKIWKTNETI